MEKLDLLFASMIQWNRGDPKRIQHFMKVHSLARLIGLQEKLDERTLFVLEAAAYVHDIGIRPSEEKYGRCPGSLQEKEGPAPAREMLSRLGFHSDATERICTLVGRHHTYADIDGPDLQILIEADFLVNLFEDNASREAVKNALEHIFKTASGKALCRAMFNV